MAKTRMVTVPRPGFDEKGFDARGYDEKQRQALTNKHYVAVPRVDLIGTFPIASIMSDESLVEMARARARAQNKQGIVRRKK